jgi:hypothetical protein
MLSTAREPAARIPGSEWTLPQAATHVVAGLSDYAESITGVRPLLAPDRSLGPVNSQIRAANRVRMEQIDAPDLASLGEQARQVVARFLDATAGRSGDEPYDWYATVESTQGAMTGIMLGEVVLHGHDIALALRRPWPISPAEAISILEGAFVLLPAYVDADAARDVEVSYRFLVRGGAPIGVRIHGGTATVERPPRAPFDCTVRADPVAMLLVSYGRASQWRYVLRGKMVASGRRPWMGLAFPRLMLNP